MAVQKMQEKVVWITGSAGNLGQVIAHKFEREGALLVLSDHGSGRLQGLFPKLSSQRHLLIEEIDSKNPIDLSRLTAEIEKRFGRLDILVNTVGGYLADEPVSESGYEPFTRMLDLNLKTAVLASQAVLPFMLKAHSGKIIHVGSRAALEGKAGVAAYSIAKAGVVRLAEIMAAELRSEGINVNCVLPGTIDTPQNREAMPQSDPAKWVTPESIADVILFLASESARDIHGAAIPVYGLS